LGSKERGSYYRWFFFLAGPLESLFTAKHSGTLAPAMSAGFGTEEDTLRTLESAVAGKTHLAGDCFTAVDLYASACLGYYMMTGALENKPAFAAYASQHAQRPAAIAANARDDALVAAHPHPGR
jgi:glutathione S-transferase